MRHLKTYTGALLTVGLIFGSAGCGSANDGKSEDGSPKADCPADAEPQQPRQQGGAKVATVLGRQISVYKHKGDGAVWKTLSSPNEMGATPTAAPGKLPMAGPKNLPTAAPGKLPALHKNPNYTG
ncbi:hypothetical protein GCM10029978_038420 [Actinoallomurus acanthiterrae]